MSKAVDCLAVEELALAASHREPLPFLATANDIRELIQFLKKRPFGVSISDIAQPIKKRVFFPKKVAAYEFWSLVSRTGEHLKLSSLGWEFARSLEPEARIYRKLLTTTPYYHDVLRWVLDQRIDVVSHTDVVLFWQDHFEGFLTDTQEKTAFATAVCFFHLCQAAELGTMTNGKRGQPARLSILRDELTLFLDGPSQQRQDFKTTLVRFNPGDDASGRTAGLNALERNHTTRVFISQGCREDASSRICELLRLNGNDYEVVQRVASADGLISKATGEIMRRCDSCIIVIGQDDYESESVFGAAVRNEISAATVLYDSQVLLVVRKGLQVPLGFQQFNWCEFDERETTWAAAVTLMKVLKGFSASTSI